MARSLPSSDSNPSQPDARERPEIACCSTKEALRKLLSLHESHLAPKMDRESYDIKSTAEAKRAGSLVDLGGFLAGAVELQ